MKKWVLIIVGIGLFLVVIGGVVSLGGQQRAKLAAAEKAKDVVKVERGEVAIRVIETGSVDAVKAVELRSRASGRLAELLVDEGDSVSGDAMIARIDPQETQLQLQQTQAQLRGAQSGVTRSAVEIEQQAVLLREQIKQAEIRLATLKDELRVQPTLTSSSITQAKSQLESAKRQREQLVSVTIPNQRQDLDRQVADARASFDISKREYERQEGLEKLGYVAPRVVESARLQMSLDQTRLETLSAQRSRLDNQQRLDLNRADEEVRGLQAAYDRAMAGTIQDSGKRREYETAVSELSRARANLKQIAVLQAGKAQSQASVDQLASVVKDSMRQLRETEVRAPFSGVVTKRYIEVGDLVTALSTFSAGTSIVRIEDRSQMRVKLQLNEIDVARLRLGMEATITVDALPDVTIKGIVKKVAPASIATGAQQATAGSEQVVKYEVEVYLNTIPSGLRTGMSAKCTMDVLKKVNVLRVPIAYVGSDKEGSFLMLAPAKPGEKAVRKNVRVGAKTGAFVEILDGAKEGDKLEKPAFTGPARTGFIQTGDGE